MLFALKGELVQYMPSDQEERGWFKVPPFHWSVLCALGFFLGRLLSTRPHSRIHHNAGDRLDAPNHKARYKKQGLNGFSAAGVSRIYTCGRIYKNPWDDGYELFQKGRCIICRCSPWFVSFNADHTYSHPVSHSR